MTGFALVVASATLGAGLVLVLGIRLLPTLRLQLTALAMLAVALPLGAVLLSGLVMFHMHDDVKILAVAAASASAAVAAALLLGREIARRIDRLEASAAVLASGDLGARASESGPAELVRLARSFNEMAASIGNLFDARRNLVVAASHDLRTPVAAIQAMLEAIEDGLVEPEEYVPALREQARTLASLVDDLFELARIDAGALTLELQRMPVLGLIESCVRGLEAEARARGVRLETRMDGRLPEVRCAPDQVQRVLQNLVANALRHTPSDGAVAVVARPADGALEVAVEDTGVGIAAGAEERVFDRFWRGDASRQRTTGGAGLGLTIARGLVEAQGGRIWAERRPDGGARVAFTLPFADAA
ncbi:MAG TPA: HAMP domain-containing sensor histidine kinase [Gaiellaceae bacterium]